MRNRICTVCAFLLLLAVCLPAAPIRTGSLEGTWDFRVEKEDKWRVAQVPLSIQAQFTDLRDFSGVAWYRKRFRAPAYSKKQTVLLTFGAIDYTAIVQVNGNEAGRHEGGYLPFTLDIGHLLHPGENEIVVRIEDPGSLPEIPHGKQSWYIQTSGIWQSVTWQVRPKQHIQSLQMVADAAGNFRALIKPLGKAKLEIVAPSGKVVHSGALDGKLDDVQTWSPATPVLYTARVRMGGDTLERRFGFRTFEKKNGKFYLNGEPFYMRAALDQDFYPDTIYTPPSKEFVLDEFRKAREIGLNMLRCHIKVPDPRYLDAADEAGLLVWYEIPNFDKLTDASEKRAEETFAGMMERDLGHPSIVIASLFNEGWGIDMKQASQREFLLGFAERARRMAPGLLIVDNSPCCDNFHLDTDIADFHEYRSIPDQAAMFGAWVHDFATRPEWLFSKYGDARPRGDEPLVVSEFGNWGLPQLPARLPWWFRRGQPWDKQGVSVPAGLEDRFRQWKLDSVFGGYSALAQAAQWHEWLALKYEMEVMRAEPSIQGYVITEFTDLNWEANGLLDMQRNKKVFGEVAAQVQADDVIVPAIAPMNAFSGDEMHVGVSLSHYSAAPTAGVPLTWRLEGTDQHGSIALPDVPRGEVKPAGEIVLRMPTVTQPRRLSLRMEAGTLARNSLDLYVYPEPGSLPDVYVHDPDGKFTLPGTRKLDENSGPGIVVSTVFDTKVRDYVDAGGKALVLVESANALPALPQLKVLARRDNLREGNWMTNVNWYRKSSPMFDGMPGEGVFGWEAFPATPEYVFPDVQPENANDVLAGLFIGWIHLPSALAVQARIGDGGAIFTTFRLGSNYARDGFSTRLLENAVAYLRSPGFNPQLRFK